MISMTEQRIYRQSGPGLGPSLQDVLEAEGILEEVEAGAARRVAALMAAREAKLAAGKSPIARPVGRRAKAER